MEQPSGVFRCPGCHQPYECPPATVELIRDHLRSKHGMKIRDRRWIERRIKPTKETQ